MVWIGLGCVGDVMMYYGSVMMVRSSRSWCLVVASIPDLVPRCLRALGSCDGGKASCISYFGVRGVNLESRCSASIQ